MSRFLRYWRIAFSALCGFAAVLLVLLWVRSCWTSDELSIPLPNSWSMGAGSVMGSCGIGISSQSYSGFSWSTKDVDVGGREAPPESVKYFTSIWGRFSYLQLFGPTLIVPTWFLIVATVVLAAIPWIRWSNRFSLRTLLIATTLVAVALGLIVWSINR